MTDHVEPMQAEPRNGLGFDWPKGSEHPRGEAKDTSPLQNGGPDTESHAKDACDADDAAPAALHGGIPPESAKVSGGSEGEGGMPPTGGKADSTEAPGATSEFVTPHKAKKEESVDPEKISMERQERMSFGRTMGDGTPGSGNHRNVMGSGEVTPKTRGVMGHGENHEVRAKGVMGRDIG